MITAIIILLVAYCLGLTVAEKLYRYSKFNEDHDVVWWSWIGVFVILLSISGRK